MIFSTEMFRLYALVTYMNFRVSYEESMSDVGDSILIFCVDHIPYSGENCSRIRYNIFVRLFSSREELSNYVIDYH